MRGHSHGISRVIRIVLLVVIGIGVFSFVTMWLWNHLMPQIFGLHAISYWQALGLLVLSKLFFGAFRGRPGWRRDWRARMGKRWEEMTPEEREKFSAAMRERCGPFGRHESVPPTPAPKE
jgi:Ca2+/H+ antiporter, TMEM165/GDT1 family